MNNKIVALFPGQGSQKVGMGKDIFDSSDLAKELFSVADKALGFSLSKICFEGPEEELVKTSNVQPAILTVSTICFEIARGKIVDSVVAAAGHSLGEYSALVATGAISFEDAVSIVHKRGKYMQEAVAQGEGLMLAVLGKEVAELEEVVSGIDGVVAIANINAPGQIVLSGAKKAVLAAKEALSGTKTVELAVSAPFHCPLMQPAADALAKDLDALTINEIETPVFSNYLAAPLTGPEEIRRALKDQVCGRVRWVESMNKINAEFPGSTFIEFGSGQVLSGLLKRIDKSIAKANVGSFSDLENL